MANQKITERARNLFVSKCRDRDEQTGRNIQNTFNNLNSRNILLNSSIASNDISKVLSDEYKIRSNISWQSISRSLEIGDIELLDDLNTDLKEELKVQLNQEKQRLIDLIKSKLRNMNLMEYVKEIENSLANIRNLSISKYGAEIDLYVDKLRNLNDTPSSTHGKTTKQPKIIHNALKILEFLIEKNIVLGNSISVNQLIESLSMPENELNVAETYLLEQHYIDGTMGGKEGVRWITSDGIEFFEEKMALIDHPKMTVIPENEIMPDNRKIFVVHGRNDRLRRDFFAFLRALGLQPLEWSEALKLTGKTSPYIGEILDSAFSNARAVVVLLTPDDEVRLMPALCCSDEDPNEKEYNLQARPNVLFEAGMAFGRNPNRTLLIEVGRVKAFSDIAGRHVVKLTNDPEKRKDVAERLRTAGCAVSTIGNDWLKTGNFAVIRETKNESIGYAPADLTEGDIIALLDDWWPKSGEFFPDNVTVNFREVDQLLSLPSGSTKNYISQVASRKNFKPVSSGNVVATFEYDVTSEHFGTFFEPGRD